MANLRDLIRAYRFSGGVVTIEDERALLRAGTEGDGLSLVQARAVLMETAAANNLVLQSTLEDEASGFLETAARGRNRVSRADFQRAADLYLARTRGALTPKQVESRVRLIAERQRLQPAPAGLSRSRQWFERIALPVADAGVELANQDPFAELPQALNPPLATPSQPSPQPSPQATAPGQPPGRAPILAARAFVLDPADSQSLGLALARWKAEIETGVAERVTALYAADAVLLATLEDDVLIGSAAILGYFRTFLNRAQLTVDFRPAHFWSDRTYGGAGGIYIFSWSDPATGGRLRSTARFSFVFRRGTGGWAIYQHHSSVTPETPAPVLG
ncbi:MAG: SnoaL-like domain-containing protein [Rhodospirillaceae bacterium]|nr:SnoaL-like domain-containing protein [Rhodospirillaceae bacterium]